MRRAGLTATNPSHPELLALIEAGATVAQFGHAAEIAVGRRKGLGYALGVLKGQLADAANPDRPANGKDPEAIFEKNRAVAAEWLQTEPAQGASQ